MNRRGQKSTRCSVLEGGWARAWQPCWEGAGQGEGGAALPCGLSRGWTRLFSLRCLSPFGSGCASVLGGQEPVTQVFSWDLFLEPASLTKKVPEVRYLEKREALYPPEQASATSLCIPRARGLYSNADSGSAGQRWGLRTSLLASSNLLVQEHSG